MSKSKVTLANVARVAGVSSATASRLINGSGPVSEDIRERVEAAIAQLGYEPRKTNSGASAHEGTIAVLAENLINPFFPEIIRGISDEIDNYGMVLTLYNLTNHPERQKLLVQKLSRQRIDGLIVMGNPPFPTLVEWQQKQGIPMVLINRSSNLPMTHCVTVDFEAAMKRATQHLLSLNHTRIGYLSAFDSSEIAIARRKGIEASLHEAGLALQPEYCSSVPPGTEIDGGFQAMNILLDRPAEYHPTAILAFNDVIATGALHSLRLHGVRIPQDMSIIGVDDIFSSVYTYPPLTTIGQPKFRMGAIAVQRLRLMSEGNWPNHNNFTQFECTLIVRESTGPAPRR